MKSFKTLSIIMVTFSIIFLPHIVYGTLISPFKIYTTMPDNSQYAADYNPQPLHGDQWGKMMCGPTSAKNSMVWLAEKFPEYQKLKQKKVGNTWVNMTHQEMIEELAKKMVPSWDWDNNYFPGVTDEQFVEGKKAYAESRGLQLNMKWIKNTSLNRNSGTETIGEPTLGWVVNEINEDEDVEISTPAHWVTVDPSYGFGDGFLVDNFWVTVSGYVGEEFNDENDNGFWDEGESFFDDTWDSELFDYGIMPDENPGIYDFFLFINDPASQNDGWQLTETINGKLYVGGLGYIETAVSESPDPEPSTMLQLGFGLLVIAGVVRKRFVK